MNSLISIYNVAGTDQDVHVVKKGGNAVLSICRKGSEFPVASVVLNLRDAISIGRGLMAATDSQR